MRGLRCCVLEYVMHEAICWVSLVEEVEVVEKVRSAVGVFEAVRELTVAWVRFIVARAQYGTNYDGHNDHYSYHSRSHYDLCLLRP